MAVNKVILIGNVGADPEVRYLDKNAGSGERVASLRVATSERYKDRNGETKEATEWHNVNVWGKSAEFVEKYVRKGAAVYVEGSLRTRSYEKDGATRYVTEIRAERVQLVGPRPQGESPAPSPNPSTVPARPETNAKDDDDLPF